MRFCSGCRGNKKFEDFQDGRKMCFRHKKLKGEPIKPTTDLMTYDAMVQGMRDALRSGDGKFEAACSLRVLHGQEEVDKELRSISKEDEPGEDRPKHSEQQQEMRRARAKCRPVLNLIQDALGYAFVYKDSRSGRRLKYAHSLRYLCAQRQDQDLTKRRSAAASAEKKKAAAQAQLVENGGQPDEATMAEQLQNASFLETAATDFNAATIAAIVQASQAATREAELENGGDGDGDGDADADGEGDDGNGGSRGGGGLSLLDGLGESGISVSGGDDEAMRSGQDNHEFDEHAQHHFQDALEYLPELEEQQDDENGKDKKGKKGKGKGKDKLNGGGAAKRMERFDCKGTLIINMYQDDETVQFALNHPMLHAEYRDVVGNSRRGFRYVPPPIEVPLVLEPAVDSPDMHGDDPWAQVENTFQSMLDLLKQLRENKGGGEEEAVQALYDSTLEVRKVRVSILEGLDRCAKGRKKAKAKKRRLDSESGIDEGALRLPPGPSGDILNNLLPDLPVSPMDGDGDGDDDLQSSMAPEVQNMVAMYVAQHTQVTSDGSWALDPSLDPSLQL